MPHDDFRKASAELLNWIDVLKNEAKNGINQALDALEGSNERPGNMERDEMAELCVRKVATRIADVQCCFDGLMKALDMPPRFDSRNK